MVRHRLRVVSLVRGSAARLAVGGCSFARDLVYGCLLLGPRSATWSASDHIGRAELLLVLEGALRELEGEEPDEEPAEISVVPVLSEVEARHVTWHALDRYGRHHASSTAGELLRAMELGWRLGEGEALSLLGRGHRGAEGTAYVAAPDSLGVFAVESETVVTYLRLYTEQQSMLASWASREMELR